MGKVNKRQPQKHSNHHDNPNRSKKAIQRRQHSQDASKKVKSRKGAHGGTTAPSTQGANAVPKQPSQVKIPFSEWDGVLLVGEGDFSFALSLVHNYTISSLVATSFDSREALQEKYHNVDATIDKLTGKKIANGSTSISDKDSAYGTAAEGEEEWNGFSPLDSAEEDEGTNSEHDAQDSNNRIAPNTTVLYGVDATKLCTTHKKILRPYSPFTKIVFNFPHVGGLSTDVNRQVRANQQLLVDFFNSTKPLLATTVLPARLSVPDGDTDPDLEYDSDTASQRQEYLKHGKILVTLFEGEPYTLWNIRDLARHSGLKVLESFKFPWSAYPGYHHARTIGDITTGADRSHEQKRKGAWRGEERDARCYILALKDDDDGRPAPGSRKRKSAHDDDSD